MKAQSETLALTRKNKSQQSLKGSRQTALPGFLLSLPSLGSWCFQLSPENSVPESAGHAESVLKVSVMVLEVVLLELLVVQRKAE